MMLAQHSFMPPRKSFYWSNAHFFAAATRLPIQTWAESRYSKICCNGIITYIWRRREYVGFWWLFYIYRYLMFAAASLSASGTHRWEMMMILRFAFSSVLDCWCYERWARLYTYYWRVEVTTFTYTATTDISSTKSMRRRRMAKCTATNRRVMWVNTSIPSRWPPLQLFQLLCDIGAEYICRF